MSEIQDGAGPAPERIDATSGEDTAQLGQAELLTTPSETTVAGADSSFESKWGASDQILNTQSFAATSMWRNPSAEAGLYANAIGQAALSRDTQTIKSMTPV